MPVGIIVAGEHLVALGSGLLSHIVELIPIAQRGLNLGRVIGAQHIFSDGAAVGKQARSRLPCGALLHAIHGNDVLGVLVLILEIIIGQADILLDIQRIFGIHIFQRVVRLDQEDVDLVIGSGAVLLEQGLVQLILVVVVIVGVDGPLYGDTVIQRRGGLVGGDLLDAGVIVVEAGLEFIVPAPDVQDLALLCGCIGSGLCGRAADELAVPPPQPASKVAAIAVAVNKLIAFFIMCFPPF